MKLIKVPIEISARHIHLNQADFIKLFGKNTKLTIKNNISQPGQFAANQTIDIKGPKSILKNVRIVGPFRKQTQLEISVTDSYSLGIEMPLVKVSGDLKKTACDITLLGKKGKLHLMSGVIISQRHLHIEPKKANELGIKNGQLVSVQTRGVRSLIFQNVIVRSHENIDKFSFQIDTDEANAGMICNNDIGILLK